MKSADNIFSNIESLEVERLTNELKKATEEGDKYFSSRQLARVHNKKLQEENAALKSELNELKQKADSSKIDPQTNAIIQKDKVVKKYLNEIQSLKKQLREAAQTIVNLRHK